MPSATTSRAGSSGALSEVAQISQTARGVVVNLPDILFDTNKATLKQNAQVALAKLAGIVSLFPNINLRIEGHTDSTGAMRSTSRCRASGPSPSWTS